MRRTLITNRARAMRKAMSEVDGATHWDDEARAKDEARDHWLISQGIRVHRVPASRVYRELGEVTDAILVQTEALIEAERLRLRLAPSTIGSSRRR
jgi:very-short-patch-repair endonuclease